MLEEVSGTHHPLLYLPHSQKSMISTAMDAKRLQNLEERLHEQAEAT
jgi:hypothetical protein